MFGLDNSNLVCTPMTIKYKLSNDDKYSKIDPSKYISMIGRLLYLTTKRLDIMYVVCVATRF